MEPSLEGKTASAEDLSSPPSWDQLSTAQGFMHEAYCCVAENLESNSYPGALAEALKQIWKPICL